jgi:hypothetical protein
MSKQLSLFILLATGLLLFSFSGVQATTYYSYVSGDWNSAETWTTDPSGTLSPSSSGVPGSGDEAVILSGRIVTLSSNVETNNITIMAGGILNLGSYKLAGSTGGTLKGQGTLRTSDTSFNATFATAEATFFEANGGTMEFNFTGDIVLDSGLKKYNNLTINLATAGSIATFSGDIDPDTRRLTIFGNLNILKGTFRIGSNTDLGSDSRVVLDIRKNVTVGPEGAISVGKVNTNTNRLTKEEFKGVKVNNTVALVFPGDPGYVAGTRDPLDLYFQFPIVESNLGGPFSISNSPSTAAGTFPTAKGSYHKIYHQVYVGGDFTNSGTVRFHNLTTMVMDQLSGWAGDYVSPTSGAASVFFQGGADNTLTCNGTTDFYNLVIDKGTDATYKLTVNSSNYDKFRLWGPNNLGGDGAFGANPISRKALWIKNGTLRLTGKVIIPSLSEGSADAFPYKVNMIDPAPTQGTNSDFSIPANGGLLIDGESVIVLNTADYPNEIALAYELPTNSVTITTGVWAGNAAACSIYGTLQVNSGYLSGRGSAGFVFWNIRGGAGNFNIKGGQVDAMQVRSAIDGGGRSTFDMSGGELRIRGRFPVFGATAAFAPTAFAQLTSFGTNPGTDFNTTREVRFPFPDGLGTLNIDQDAAVFNMSGGKIHILDVVTNPPAKAIEINSTLGNYQVTGGEIHVYVTNGQGPAGYVPNDPHITVDNFDYYIASAVPLANLSIHHNSGATRKVLLRGITPCCGRESGITTRRILPLNVLSNLQINSGATFDADGQDVIVGGNLTIASSATYITGVRSALTASNSGTLQTTTFNGAGAQTLTVAGAVQVTPGQSGFNSVTMNKATGTLMLASDITVRRTLTLTQGTLPSANGIFDDSGKFITVTGDVYNDAIHTGTGKIQLEGGISSVTVNNQGTYTLPRMAGVGGTSAATFRLQIIDGKITSIDVVNGGAGFLQNAGALGTFTFSGGTGTGASAKYSINSAGTITSVILGNGGTGYGPLASASGGAVLQTLVVGNTTSSGATTNGRLLAVDVINPGAGYVTVPAITISGTGGATATASMFNIIAGNGNGRFGNLTLNKPNFGATLTAAQTVNNTLTLANGVLDINIYQLSLTSANAVAGGGFSAGRMIKTGGNFSDGGVRKTYSTAGVSFLFPIGSDTKYTPATIALNGSPSGTISVRLEKSKHPFVTSPNALNHYWRVTSAVSGHTSASHEYQYVDADVVGDENLYVPGRYDKITNAWVPNGGGEIGDVDKTSNKIVFNGVIDGEYTAGISPAFGNVLTFYSKKSGNWNAPNTWSNVSHTGPDASAIPLANNPVIIGDGNTNNHIVTVTANGAESGGLQLNSKSVLDVGATTGNNFGRADEVPIGGSGTLRISATNAVPLSPQFPAGDFGNFIGEAGGTVEYYTAAADAKSFAIPIVSNTPTSLSLKTYKNLVVNAGAGQTITLPSYISPVSALTVYGNLLVGYSAVTNQSFTGSALLSNVANGDVNVSGDLEVRNGTLQFSNNAGSALVRNVTVEGDIRVGAGGTFNVANNNIATTHQLVLKNNLLNNGIFDMNTGSGYVANVTFKEINNNTISGTGSITDFNILTVDKGTFQTPLLEVNASNFTLPTPTTSSASPLVLLNGTFRLTSAQSIELTQRASFTIPATACLSTNGGTITIGNSNSPASNNPGDLLLAGKLEVLNGTVNVGTNPFGNGSDNDIRYATVGFPEINILGGTLNVTGSIRKSFNNDNIDLGALVYKQTGGLVVLGNGLVTPSRAKLEIDNPGSVFDMSGGTIRIFRGGALTSTSVPAPGFGDLYLNPASSTVTGGRIVFFPGGNSRTFNIDVRIPLYDFEVLAQTATCKVILNNVGLVVKNNLTIRDASGATTSFPNTATFDANGFDVNVGGTFTNRGTYVPGNNTTIFSGTSSNVNLGFATTFNNVAVTTNGTAAFNGPTFSSPTGATVNSLTTSNGSNNFTSISPVIKGNLTIGSTSTVDVKTNTLHVSGNVINNNSQTNTTGGINLHRSLASVSVTNAGSYALPTITGTFDPMNGGTGTAAVFNVTITDGVITAISIVSGGSNYISGSLSIIGSGNGVTATYTESSGIINSINLTAGGSGYGPSATATGGSGTGATVQVVVNGNTGAAAGTGTVSAVNVVLAGTNFQSSPTIAFNAISQLSQATAAAYISSLPNNLSGTGKTEFGNLTNNNNLGVTTSSNVTVNGALTFGVDSKLDIADNRLILGTSATVVGARSQRYIRTNGALSDLGVRKRFANTTNQTFVFPVGISTEYTPVTYSNLSISSASNAFINVKPINAKHPNVSGPNYLKYYWNVTSTGGNFTTSHLYQYPASNYVNGNENALKNGRLIDGVWNVGNTSNVNTSNHTVSFDALGTSLTGDYTAAANFDDLITYTSNAASMSWSESSWIATRANGEQPEDNVTGPPTDGSIVVIRNGHVVSVGQNTKLTNKLTINGVLDVGNTIRHSFGTVDGSGKLRISATDAGDFVFPAGTFTNFIGSPSSIVEYYGNKDGDILTRRDFNHVLFSGTSRKRLTQDLEVSGNLAIEGGTVDNTTNSKTVELKGNWMQTAGRFTAGSGTINVKGSFSNANPGIFDAESSTLNLKGSSISTGNFNAGSSTVRLDSAQIQTITGSTAFYNLVVNGGTNKMMGPGTNLIVNGNLSLNSGWILTSASNTLTLGSNATVMGGSNASFIQGPLSKVGNNAFTFPVGALIAGTTRRFAPIGVSSLSNVTTFTAEYFAAAPVVAPVLTPLTHLSNIEYWNLRSNTPTSAHTTLYWDVHSYVGNPNTLAIAAKEAASWISVGGRDASGTTSNGFISSQNLTTFTAGNTVPLTFGNLSSEFTNPLPIRLLDFTGVLDRDVVFLDWHTLSEESSSHFVVERSANGETYVSVGRVEARGNSRKKEQYGFSDVQPLSGTSYYRLKIVDQNGSFEFSKSIRIRNLSSKESATLYPNPIERNEPLRMQVYSANEKTCVVSMYDLHGRELSNQAFEVGEGLSDFAVKQNLDLPAGMYIVRMKSLTLSRQFKLIVH